MALRDGKGPLMYSDSDPGYEEHFPHILRIVEKALERRLLHKNHEEKLINDDGEIVCDRPRGDQEVCVSKLYFGRALECERRERNEHDFVAEIRDLLYQVLAVHYSIAEGGEENVDEYTSKIRQADTLGRNMGVKPSLFPNLFDAASLRAQVEKAAGYDYADESVVQYVLELARLLKKQPRHLHALTTGVLRSGGKALAGDCISEAAIAADTTPLEMCRQNPILLDTYVQALSEAGQHREAVELCKAFGFVNVLQYYDATQYLIRSMLDLGSFEELHSLLMDNADQLKELLRGQKAHHVRKAIGAACETLGWVMNADKEYDEAIALLETLVPIECGNGPGGRENMQALLAQLKRRGK